ncbi:hypothetical protein IFM89_018587 [Coptis chinensis]|uniref:1-acylglycerol-3-phosphate O-acyltransferase n=1 Tax=Coptis chinensis TaxID=261450 RepID=A0A835LW66_9MAGN|nr:hypothetical protein IFM89_018587 [Coptis chinensis]
MNGDSTVNDDGVNDKKTPEVSRPSNSNDGPRHHPLTPLRLLRGLLCLLILISTAFMMLVYLAPVVAVLFRLFSVKYSRKVTSFFFGTWLSLWPYLFERINKTKVVFGGEALPAGKRALLLVNHRTEVDWMYLWDLALRKGRLGYIKYILKSSLMKLPIFGWGFHILDFISVERKWEVDESNMHKMLSTFTDPQDPLWLALFPEGTDFSEQKCLQSQKFATENGLPVLQNVLLPKTKGFFACLEVLRDSLDAVYDVTIAYKHRCPTFTDNLFGVDPSEVHIYVRCVTLNKIPTNEDEAATWLMEAFQLKDQLLSNFKINGYFPNQGTEGNLSKSKGLTITNSRLCEGHVSSQVPVKDWDYRTVADWQVQYYRGLESIFSSPESTTLSRVINLSVRNIANAAVFTLKNQCSYTVWPGTLSGNNATPLGEGGFALAPSQSISLTAQPGWSGRFWARTGCNFDNNGAGVCATGDCGGVLKCTGGGVPPVSLAEFTLGVSGSAMSQDFYDVSLVDGYNVGVGIKPSGGTGDCQYAGCVADLNASCPAELQVTTSSGIVACKSACAAFGTPEYCCTADHGSPSTCSPTKYSQMFKSACPTSYSYAYDDGSSTCTCTGTDYLITFCPTDS